MRGTAVLSVRGPAPSTDEVIEFITATYAPVADVARLTSERDENYRVAMADGSWCLFKLTHPAEDRAVVDFQTQAFLHVAAAASAIPVQRLLPSVSGAFETLFTGSDGPHRRARLFTYLVGTPLSQFPPSAPQAVSLGGFAARLDAALADFRHPADNHELLWDLQHAAQTRRLLEFTDAGAVRDLCGQTLDRFERETAPAIHDLRAQVIHNDLNPHNVLANPSNPDQLTGIIDFGDMVRAPLINEVAVASAYLVAAGDDPLGTVPHFLAAYHSYMPLEAAELAVLPQLIAVRQAITIAITNWRATLHPQNRGYILRNQGNALAGLHKLAVLEGSEAIARLVDACGGGRP